MDDTVSELSGESIPSDDYEFINDPLQVCHFLLFTLNQHFEAKMLH